jgi:ribosome biogenesis GTPase
MKHEVPHEEQKRRKRESAERRAQEEGRRPKRRRRSGEDDDEPSIEKLRRRRGRARTLADGAPPALSPPPLDASPAGERGVITGVFGARCAAMVDGQSTVLRTQGHAVVVGDEVRVQAGGGGAEVGSILEVFPRRTWLARGGVGGRGGTRLIAANIDVAVIVLAPRGDDLRFGLADRILLALALCGGGVSPVVVVNKADRLPLQRREAAEAGLHTYRDLLVPAHLVSAHTGEGVGALRAQLLGRTVVFMGQSGVGKSTLLNILDPSRARLTQDVRASDARGRHTTTASELVALDDGTRLIDTPGVREFGLWPVTQEDLARGFQEIAAAATRCRFRNCRHRDEPACAVVAAVADGTIAPSRLTSFRRLADENC